MIKEIKNIGDDKYKEEVLAKAYAALVLEKISKDKPSLSLNYDILVTKDVLISIEVTRENPFRFENQETKKLFLTIDNFLEKDPEQVLLVLGSAGSGKSLALQIKFIEAINAWDASKPLPVYFNLANETSLDKNFELLNKLLRTNMIRKEPPCTLFLDSFDEGFDMENKRKTLGMENLSIMGKSSKLIICCRTEYLDSDNDFSWFKVATCFSFTSTTGKKKT